MRTSLQLGAAFLLVSGAFLSVDVDAMDGKGSPWDFESCTYPNPALCAGLPASGVPAGTSGYGGGHPWALFKPTGTHPNPDFAVFYPNTNLVTPSTCYNSPRQMPYEPTCAVPNFGISSPFYGMGPPSQRSLGNPPPPPGAYYGPPRGPQHYRTYQPCNPTPTAVFVAAGLDPGPLKPVWTPIESIQNTHATVNKYVAIDSVAHTPFQAAGTPGYGGGGGTPPYSHNEYNDPFVLGYGRWHLDDEQVVSFVGSQSNQGGLPFTSEGNPEDVEGAPDTKFVILGNDGYILGRFETPVTDQPGYDIMVNSVFSANGTGGGVVFPTFCVFGATHPAGPYVLVHSAFNNGVECDTTNQTTAYCPWIPSTADGCPSPGPNIQLYCWNFDLNFFYTPVRRNCGVTCTRDLSGNPTPPERLDYFLIVNSLDRTPYLKADFTVFPFENSLSCINLTLPRYGIQPANDPSYPACPPVQHFPQVQRMKSDSSVDGAYFHFMATAVRFGFPMYQMAPAPFPDDVANTGPDPINEWNWDFSSDPYAIPVMFDYRPDPYVTVNPPSRGKPETVWPMEYVPPGDYLMTPPPELWTYQRKMFSITGPADPLANIDHVADHNRSHRYFSTGIFPACLSVHTTVDQVLDQFMAHWRQSDPPYSDPWPTGNGGGAINMAPPNPPVEHRIPHPSQMFCKPVTVFNVRPQSAFGYLAEYQNPRKFTFYSQATDTDWISPAAEHPFDPTQLVPSGKTHPNPYFDHYHAPLCWDCPPDGISVRQWDFRNDGFGTTGTYGGKCMPVLPAPNCNTFTTTQGDVSWRFLSRQITPAYSHDPTIEVNSTSGCNTWPDPLFCNQFFGGNPMCQTVVPGPFDWTKMLHTTTPQFSVEDVGARVSGFGIEEGTRVIAFLSSRCVQVNKVLPPSFVSQSKPAGPPWHFDRWPLTVALSWPYEETQNSPTFTYPGPGNYSVKHTVCDKEYRVEKTRTTSNQHFGQLASVRGDPMDVVWGSAASGTVPSWAPPTVPPSTAQINLATDTAPPNNIGKSLHACHSITEVVRIENQPPTISTPPNFVVRAGQPVEFRVTSTDADFSQVLTMRLCADQEDLPNPPSFPEASTPGPASEFNRQFSWRTTGLPLGRYGPVCFEVTDGVETVRTQTNIYVVDETTDSDGDGIADLSDNCPGTPNFAQNDANRDGLGDACEGDRRTWIVRSPPLPVFPEGVQDQDADGVPDERDNCPTLANRDQMDRDGDTLGDICDIDADGDHVVNQDDNCPLIPNRDQMDLDGDGGGDACVGARLAPPSLGRDVSAQDDVDPAQAGSTFWATAMAIGLATLVMVAILVPLLVFAIRRNQGGRGDSE